MAVHANSSVQVNARPCIPTHTPTPTHTNLAPSRVSHAMSSFAKLMVACICVCTFGTVAGAQFDSWCKWRHGLLFAHPTRPHARAHRCHCQGLQSERVSEELPPRILGVGVCGVDFLARVAEYPAPDAKIRTTAFDVQGGGNAGNTLTALSRLGASASVLTKVGCDANGKSILQGLETEGIDTSHAVSSPNTPSAFTYVIVDEQLGTRTCIHTPMTEELLPEEVKSLTLEAYDAVHFDSRHTKAAIDVAKLCKRKRIPTFIDAEKDRPFFRELLPLMDFIMTNQHFPTSYTGRDDLVGAMVDLMKVGQAKLVVSTLGANGSIAVYRKRSPPAIPTARKNAKWASQLDSVFGEITRTQTTIDGEEYVCIRCQPWAVMPHEIVDTTGAGDAFIGGFIFGMCNGYTVEQCLCLSSLVAGEKLKSKGARAGIPQWTKVASLLSQRSTHDILQATGKPAM